MQARPRGEHPVITCELVDRGILGIIANLCDLLKIRNEPKFISTNLISRHQFRQKANEIYRPYIAYNFCVVYALAMPSSFLCGGGNGMVPYIKRHHDRSSAVLMQISHHYIFRSLNAFSRLLGLLGCAAETHTHTHRLICEQFPISIRLAIFCDIHGIVMCQRRLISMG